MSASATMQQAEPRLELPGGFPPDTVGFAIRTTLALLLAYYISFWIQLSSASSAGVCVAIVAQPQSGGAISKAVYRIIGTLVGGIVAVIAIAVFGQDRTMLLVAFTVWLAACNFVASLLKDFRAYGATLAGYTLAIVAISDIDLPQDVLLTALDRMAAILVGVVSLALVNSILGQANAWQSLSRQLDLKVKETVDQSIRTLRGDQPATALQEAQRATAILALRTQATYVVGELQDGQMRAAGARSAIAALLAMLSTNRAIGEGLELVRPDATVQAAIARTIAGLEQADAPTFQTALADAGPDGNPALAKIFLLERLDALLAQHALALDGLAALADGRSPVRRVRLLSHHDVTGAALNATRAAIVTGLAAAFCIYAGWAGATLLLVQTAAVVALLGMQPNPTQAAINFSAQVPLGILAAGWVEFFLLPQYNDFLAFSLAVAPFALIACAVARHPRSGAGASTGMLLWYALTLAPSNPQSYNLQTFLNTAMELSGAAGIAIVGFAVILPVSPPRRLMRVMQAACRDLHRTLSRRQPPDRLEILTSRYDRLASGLIWLGRPTQARLSLLSRLRDLGELDNAVERAYAGLSETLRKAPALAQEVTAAQAVLAQAEPMRTSSRQTTSADIIGAAANLLTAADVARVTLPAVGQAVSGLFGASLLLMRQQRFLRVISIPTGR